MRRVRKVNFIQPPRRYDRRGRLCFRFLDKTMSALMQECAAPLLLESALDTKLAVCDTAQNSFGVTLCELGPCSWRYALLQP